MRSVWAVLTIVAVGFFQAAASAQSPVCRFLDLSG